MIKECFRRYTDIQEPKQKNKRESKRKKNRDSKLIDKHNRSVGLETTVGAKCLSRPNVIC